LPNKSILIGRGLKNMFIKIEKKKLNKVVIGLGVAIVCILSFSLGIKVWAKRTNVWWLSPSDPIPGVSQWANLSASYGQAVGISAADYTGKQICLILKNSTNQYFAIARDGRELPVNKCICDSGPYTSGYGRDTMAFLSCF
jgi:hypothetical protein